MTKTLELTWTAGALLALMGAGCSETPPIPGPMAPTGSGGLTATGGIVVGTGGTIGSGGIIGSGGLTATGGVVVATGGTQAPPVSASDLPCDVAEVVEKHCHQCHGAAVIGGAPMSLITIADFQAMGMGFQPDSKTTPVHTLVADRINRPAGAVGVMPQAGPMPSDELAILNGWLEGGMPAATTACDQPATGGMQGTGGMEGTGGVVAGPGWPNGKPEETCYQLFNHGGQTPGDTTPYTVPTGETYANFYFKVPWTVPSVATRVGTIKDQEKVLHHWLMYESTASTAKDGNVEGTSAAGAAGLHLTASTLLAGWAIGGNDMEMPEGVGLTLPPPGSMMEIEWHLYNNGGPQVQDRSGVEICVVPKADIDAKYIADTTWLGTENLTIPGNSRTEQGGMCTPSFAGGDEINIVIWSPHMHTIGVHMDTWIMRQDGTEEHVFDKPFQFDRQISYIEDKEVIVKKGDRLHTVCTFENMNSGTVSFGQSTQKEMCYQFVVAYPANSLRANFPNNGVLTGAKNGCLSFNTLVPHAN